MNQNGLINPMIGVGVAPDLSNHKNIRIGERSYLINGDRGYTGTIANSAQYEPDTTATLRALTREPGATALDVGANIGLTALAMSQSCSSVIAFEPISATFGFLSENIAGETNIRALNFALGSTEGSFKMQGSSSFLAGAFVADNYTVNDGHHFTEEIQVRRLDNVARSSGINRVDLIKIDVEGFELEVLEGAGNLLGDLKPIAYLEMNHWCLNMFRRISIPEFRERLLKTFPFIFAVDGSEFIDFADPRGVHAVCHAHIMRNRFNNIVAGFDRDELVARLELRKEMIDGSRNGATQPS